MLITCIIWFLIYRRIRIIRNRHEVEKKVLDIEKQLYDTELQALRLQMNPHFIFNTLNSIQSFILTKDTDKAVNYLGKFSQLMRLILIHSTETYISISEELKALQYYMDLEMLRFENKFTYTITVDPGIDEEFTEVPPMIIQPYVENAIIHGLMHKKGDGCINIHLKPDNNSIVWIIEDNGIGREKSMQIQKESGLQRKSRGMLITMERLEVLNKKNNENYSIEIIDLRDGNNKPKGTRVELRMPYNDG
jgi:sensor histidine kinase YesM